MTMPPPPSQPPSGPQGPPPGPYGYPPTPPPGPPGGGFGPPGSGGFGPPGSGAGWPPPPPGGGGGKGRIIAAIAAGAVVVVALVVAGVLFLTGGDDGKDEADSKSSPSPSATTEPEELPSDEPSDDLDDPATEFPEDDATDDPTDGSSDLPLPAFMMKEGDCFDLPEGEDATKGGAVRRECDEPHYGEIVKMVKLSGSFDTDSEVKKKASSLCESPLREKWNKQPSGTADGTLISYPKASVAGSGFDEASCSLTANKGETLKKPLK